jgi:hypothetical protein
LSATIGAGIPISCSNFGEVDSIGYVSSSCF